MFFGEGEEIYNRGVESDSITSPSLDWNRAQLGSYRAELGGVKVTTIEQVKYYANSGILMKNYQLLSRVYGQLYA